MTDSVVKDHIPSRSFRETLAPYFRPMPFVSFLLGVSSGFPLTLLLATMTFWLSKVGIEKSTIGFAIGLTTPYTLKFLWAPLVDKLPLPILTRLFGQRRAWLYFVQALLFAALWQLGASEPEKSLTVFAIWAIIVAFLSATQDIVIDAYRIEILSDQELPHGTAMNQFGYRTGNLLAGAGTVWLASTEGMGYGWAVAYGLTAFLVLPCRYRRVFCRYWQLRRTSRAQDRARLGRMAQGNHHQPLPRIHDPRWGVLDSGVCTDLQDR